MSVRHLTLLLMVWIVCAASQTAGAQTPYLRSFVLGAGGAEAVGPTYRSSGTLGQSPAGMLDGETYTVGAGFWSSAYAVAVPGAGGTNGPLSGGLALEPGAYGSLEEVTALDISAQAITVEAWVKHDGTGDEDAVVVGKTRGDGGYELRLEGTGEEVPAHFGVRFPDLPGYSVTSTEGIRAGRWTHLAGTYDGDTLRIYVDGRLSAKQVLAGFTVGSSDVPLRLGTRYDAGGQYFSGRVDEMRIWSAVRSGEVIRGSMFDTLAGDEPGLEAYYKFGSISSEGTVEDASANLHDLALTGDAGTGAGALPPPPDLYGRPVDGGVRLEWTARGTGAGSAFTVYHTTRADGSGLTAVGTVSESCADVPCALDLTGPETDTPGFYTIQASDVVPGDLAPTMPAMAYPPQESSGYALALRGAGYATVADRLSLDIPGHAVTLEAWILHDGTSSENAVIASKTEGEGGYELRLGGASEEAPAQFGVRFPDRDLYFVSSGLDIPPGKWTHLAGTYDGEQLLIYVDGELAGERALDGFSVGTSDVPLRMGASHDAARHFSGLIDEVRLWNVARTEEDIRAAHAAPLLGNEDGLRAYFRFDHEPGSSAAYGSTRMPMTAVLEGDASFDVSAATPAESPPLPPNAFALKPNYPNPFRRSTTIRFDLPSPSKVVMSVFDLTGRKVMQVDRGSLPAGTDRKIRLDAERLPAGVYFYRITAASPSSTKAATGRMVIVR